MSRRDPNSCMADRPDLETAKDFWRLYTGDENSPIRIALLPVVAWPEELKQRGIFNPYPPIEREGTLDQLWPLVEENYINYATYFFANETPPGYVGNIRNRDVTAIRSLHTDHDNGLPAEWHFPPSIIVHTSTVLGDDGQLVRKGAAYWLVNDLPVSEFSAAQKQLIAHYGSDKQVCDAKRVMRLPGSVHRKPAGISGEEIRAKLIADPSKETVDSIPLSAPSVVTFTEPCAGLGYCPFPAAAVLDGLRTSSSHTSGTSSRSSDTGPDWARAGEAKSDEELLAVLRFNNPYVDREGWRKTVTALPGIPAYGDADEAMDRRLDMAKDFEAGRLFHRLPTPEERKHLGGAHRGPAEVEKLFNWALESGNECGGFGALVNRAKEESPDWNSKASAAGATYTPPAAAATGEHRRIRLNSVSEMWDKPPLVDLVEGLITEHEDAVFVSVPKTGKSFLALEIGICVASGRAVLRKYPVNRQGAVIYLSGEGHTGMSARIKAWCTGHDITEEEFKKLPFFYNEGVPLAAEGIAEALAFVAAIKERVGDDVVLIIVDTMARSLGGLNENDSASANQYLELTSVFRKNFNCATLTVAHASHKTSNPREPDLRGSTNFHAGFDSMWTLRKGTDNQTVSLEGKWFKDQPENNRKPAYFKLRDSWPSAVLEPAPAPAPEGKTRREALEIKMRALGLIGHANAALTDQLAHRLVSFDCPGRDDPEGVSAWHAEYNEIEKDLIAGMRSRGAGRPAVYAGLFHKGVSKFETTSAVEKALAGGGKKADVLWYIEEKE